MSYNPNNIFAKIISGKITCTLVHQDDFCLAFHDLHPAAPIHVLVIPKGHYENFDDFSSRASSEEINGFFKGVRYTLEKLKLINKDGYRLITNAGLNGLQSVGHFHIHILAGEKLGPLLVKDIYHK